MAIQFFEEGVRANLKNKIALKKFIQKKIESAAPELKEIDLNIIFCKDDYLLEKNIEFLNHDTLTDIITFDLSPAPTSLHAEIYISRDRVVDNAKQYEVSYQNELHRVIFHGILHLLGYGDKTEQESKEMRHMESKFIAEYGLID